MTPPGRTPVAVVGASGYSGAVLTQLLLGHPGAELVGCTSDKWRGRRVWAELGPLGSAGPMGGVSAESSAGGLETLVFVANAEAEHVTKDAAVVFLATSAEVSAALAPRLLERGCSVIDLSGAFRLPTAAAHEAAYGFAHPVPALLPAHYGLVELFGAPPVGTRLIANPGCYATAASLAVAPLVRAGLVSSGAIIIDAKSGVTGAGRRASEEYSFSEVAGDLRAYKLFRHQHTPEIESTLRMVMPTSADEHRVVFTPHLVPVRRGLLATCYVPLAREQSTDSLEAVFDGAYGSHALVDRVAAEEVRMAAVAGTPRARLGVVSDGRLAIVVCAIDNLMKGAASQALQNFNLLRGYPPFYGLDHSPRFAL